MKKILILLLVLFSISCFGLAKQFMFIKGGLSIAKFGGDDVKKPENKLGFNVGLGASFRSSDIAYFEPEISYIQKGCEFSGETYYSDNETVTYSLNYIELAPLFAIKANKSKTRPFLKIGPYFAFLLNSEIELDKANESESVDEYFTDADFGFVLGAGLDFDKVMLEARLTKGLAEIGDGPLKESDVSTTAININFSYKFGKALE